MPKEKNFLTFHKKKNKLLDKLEKQWDKATKAGAVIKAARIAKRWISVSNRAFD